MTEAQAKYPTLTIEQIREIAKSTRGFRLDKFMGVIMTDQHDEYDQFSPSDVMVEEALIAYTAKVLEAAADIVHNRGKEYGPHSQHAAGCMSAEARLRRVAANVREDNGIQ